jgi:NADH-quinone oxidoreductase subunit L
MAGVFVTSLYSFRLLYMTFHGKERFRVEHAAFGHGHDAHAVHHDAVHHDDAHGAHDVLHDDDDHHGTPGVLEHAPHESPWVVTVPLVLLAIPSIVIGGLTVGPMLFGDWFGKAIHVNEANNVLAELGHEFHGAIAAGLHGFMQAPFWLAFAGFAVATYIYLFNVALAGKIKNALKPVYNLLDHKYWIDELYFAVFARGGVKLGEGLSKVGDTAIIDGAIVNGSANLVQRIAGGVRRLQSGFLFHYAFAMILGLILLLGGFWLIGQ